MHMPLKRTELNAAPADAVRAIGMAIEERGFVTYCTIDHARDIEGSGAVPFHAFTIMFGGPRLSSMLLGKNVELSVDLPLRISVVSKDDGCVVIARDVHSLLGDFQMANAEDTANLVNRIVEDVVDLARSRCSTSGNA